MTVQGTSRMHKVHVSVLINDFIEAWKDFTFSAAELLVDVPSGPGDMLGSRQLRSGQVVVERPHCRGVIDIWSSVNVTCLTITWPLLAFFIVSLMPLEDSASLTCP